MMDNRSHYLLSLTGLIAFPFYLALIVILGALEPGFSHLTTTMSLLGGVPGLRGLVFNLGVATTGVLIIVFDIGLWQQLPARATARIGVGLLFLGGLGLIGAGYFHCNEGCRNVLTEPDLLGQLHLIMSLLAGMGTALAPFFFWAAMRHSEQWQAYANPTLIAAILANLPGITFWLTIFAGQRLESIEGLLQRLGFIVVLIWIFFVAARMWRQACRDN
ncbi:MAG: DUF998 domain-containing protein [Thiohalomonadales bacterium]|nr:DUF998 domain-containing protein [Thiohalomonadales bacterium]